MHGMANPKATKKRVRDIMKNLTVESVLNRDGDLLPFGLFDPLTEGKVTWNCGADAEEKVTSVFKYEDPASGDCDKQCAYVTYEDARGMRDKLVEDGWRKIVPPKVVLRHPDTKRPLTRKEKRRAAKKIAKLSKQAAATGTLELPEEAPRPRKG